VFLLVRGFHVHRFVNVSALSDRARSTSQRCSYRGVRSECARFSNFCCCFKCCVKFCSLVACPLCRHVCFQPLSSPHSRTLPAVATATRTMQWFKRPRFTQPSAQETARADATMFRVIVTIDLKQTVHALHTLSPDARTPIRRHDFSIARRARAMRSRD
jgi:hypothetical protein